jgi:hypothetical protein
MSTASATAASVIMLTPNHALKVRDFSVQITAAVGIGGVRNFNLLVNGSEAFSPTECRIVLSTPGAKCTVAGPVDIPANSTLAIEDNTGFSDPADALFAFRLTNS